MRILFIVTLALMSIFYSTEASAQEYHSSFSKWHVYKTQDQGNRVCYITSQPTKKTGNYKRRGEPYMIVTHRKDGADEISISSGYPYKNHSNVDIAIDKKKGYSLFTTPEYPRLSWARTSAEDEELILLMKKGLRLEATGYSRLGTYSVDSYSLVGFTKAYQQMKALCKSTVQ